MRTDLFYQYLKKESKRANKLLSEALPSAEDDDIDNNPELLGIQPGKKTTPKKQTPPVELNDPRILQASNELRATNELQPPQDVNADVAADQPQQPLVAQPTQDLQQPGVPAEVPNQQLPVEDPTGQLAMAQDPTAMGQTPAPDAMAMGQPAVGMPVDQFGQPVDQFGQPALGPTFDTSQQDTLDPEYIGKVMMLKKIHARLISVNNNLEYFSDPKYDEMKQIILEGIDVFRSIVANFSQFKDKLDDVIKGFQEFLDSVTSKFEKLSSEPR